MTRILCAAFLALLPLGDGAQRRTQTGSAAHYRPNLMEQVSRNRGLPVVDCMVAVTSDHRIGAWVTVTSHVTGYAERCRITDVCAPRDCGRIARRGIVAEIGWTAARRLCRVSRYGEQPPSRCPVTVRR